MREKQDHADDINNIQTNSKSDKKGNGPINRFLADHALDQNIEEGRKNQENHRMIEEGQMEIQPKQGDPGPGKSAARARNSGDYAEHAG